MPASSAPEFTIANYELIRAVGQGGMAQVWLARRRLAGDVSKACALKVPLKHIAGDERFRRMFLAEARLAMQLCHGNIVTTFDAGSEGELLYMAMEWVDGVDLAQLVERLRQRSVLWNPAVAAQVIGDLLHALSYAHSFAVAGQPQGIVHRDVSPHNVLISASGEVKLTDFGIARIVNEDTSHEHAKGKLRYMAAEQLQGAACPQSDLFAAGAILHEMLEGQRFREQMSGAGFFGAIYDGAIPPLSRTDVPPALERLRSGLLQRDLDKRIGSAEEALELLAQWPGYRDHRTSLRKLYQTHFGGTVRRSGLTESIVWTPEMADTLAIAARQGSLPVPGLAHASVENESRTDADSTGPATYPPVPRSEPTSFLPEANTQRRSATSFDVTWTAAQTELAPPQRAWVWVAVALVAGLMAGCAGVVGWFMFAPALAEPIARAAVDSQAEHVEAASIPIPMAARSEPVPTEPEIVLAPEEPVIAYPVDLAVEVVEPAVEVQPEAVPATLVVKPTTKARARVTVHIVLDFVEAAEVRVGRTRRVITGPTELRVAAGRHAIFWRVPGQSDWIGGAQAHFSPGTEHLLRVRPDGVKHQPLLAH